MQLIAQRGLPVATAVNTQTPPQQLMTGDALCHRSLRGFLRAVRL